MSDKIAALMTRLYGFSATARPLSGERDLNFHLTTTDGQQYLLRNV
jgi:Ser/Thr protein kinase RdoA (MazF antagonist)